MLYTHHRCNVDINCSNFAQPSLRNVGLNQCSGCATGWAACTLFTRQDTSTAEEKQREGLHVFKSVECFKTTLIIDEIQNMWAQCRRRKPKLISYIKSDKPDILKPRICIHNSCVANAGGLTNCTKKELLTPNMALMSSNCILWSILV